MGRLLLIDTDIGIDVDDAYGVALAALSNELELIGITTVYGNVKNRVRIAQELLRLCERPDIPVVAGSPKPLGGGPFPLNPRYLLSWKEGGHEGRGILDEYDQPAVSIPPIHGSIFMIEALRQAKRPVSQLIEEWKDR